jgi:hypothetical protein
MQYPEGLWDSPNHDYRAEITIDELETMPLVDENGHEIPIYTENGYQIQRRVARFRTVQQPHGVLMQLSTMSNLFATNDDNNYMDGVPGPDTSEFSVYPQAGMRTAGHFQAKGLMTAFYPRVEAINTRLVLARDDEDDIPEEEQSSHPPVTGIASQGYNAVMHSTRGMSNQHHDAQVGLVTGALSGAWAKGERLQRIARDMNRTCDHRLPHDSFAEKITNPQIKRDLRLENVYFVDLQALPNRMRNGR